METILRVSRSRQHALTTALRVDMAYLCVDVTDCVPVVVGTRCSPSSFKGEAYGDGFGYRMGVIMTVFTCAMWVLTMAVADLQNGYRLRGIIPASRKSQVAARYVVGLVISVLSIAMIVLIDGLQVLVNPDWSFAGNLWAAPLGGFCTRADGRAYRAHGLSVDQTRRSSSHDDGGFMSLYWLDPYCYLFCLLR